MSNRPTGVDLIAAERARQKLATSAGGEGYTAKHDAGHGQDLAIAGALYAMPPALRSPADPEAPDLVFELWPWSGTYWHATPADRVRELTKAGALIAAAIDSLQAEETTSATQG